MKEEITFCSLINATDKKIKQEFALTKNRLFFIGTLENIEKLFAKID
jgi:hypothetical protein